MELVKNLFVIAVLGAVGYGVYVTISGPSDEGPPPEISNDWEQAPDVEFGAQGEPQAAADGGNAGPEAITTLESSPLESAAQWNTDAPETPPSPPSGSQSRSPDPSFPADSSANLETAPAIGGQELSQAYPSEPQGNGHSEVATSSPQLENEITAANGGHADRQFEATLAAAHSDLNAARLDEALLKLSPWFGDPRLSSQNQHRLTTLLDQLAGSVIYSREHHLEPPYEVKDGDRLEEIAERYSVPWQLLAKINGLTDPRSIQPGDQLKVVRGPFAAVVDLKAGELTLVAGDRYAGRFPVQVNPADLLPAGRLAVQQRLPEPPAETLASADSLGSSSYPGHWIGLSGEVGIHAEPEGDAAASRPLPNCIRLSRRNMEDLHDILSIGSDVIIRR